MGTVFRGLPAISLSSGALTRPGISPFVAIACRGLQLLTGPPLDFGDQESQWNGLAFKYHTSQVQGVAQLGNGRLTLSSSLFQVNPSGCMLTFTRLLGSAGHHRYLRQGMFSTSVP